jgi:CDP-diacylglycerol--glycerol-3-phosphate 3-phosphatidyltransferase
LKALPNLLTVLRLVLSLAMFAALAVVGVGLSGAGLGPAGGVFLVRFSLAAFVVAALTDFLDGWLARRSGAASVLGAILDPIADKVLVCAAILGLLATQTPGVLIPGGLILFREFAVSALRETLAPRGISLPVTFLAKTKTTLQLVALGALMVVWFWPAWRIDVGIEDLRRALQAAQLLLAVAAAVTLWTGAEYGWAAWRALRNPSPPAGESGGS